MLDALDLLLDLTRARAGAAFDFDGECTLVVERGLGAPDTNAGRTLRATLRRFAERSARSLQPISVLDLRRESGQLSLADEFFATAFKALLAVPILQRQVPLAAIVLLFEHPNRMDEETRSFTETVANLMALALQREARLEQEQRAHEELEDHHRMASLGLLTASVAHELRGPAGALVLQIEEQRRLLDQLLVLGGSSDTAIGGVVSELAELTDDVEVATARVRDTVDRLSTVSRRESEAEPLDVRGVVRESLSVVRPHLERRGIALIDDLEANCFTRGRRDSLGQVVLNLVFNAADACEASETPPQVMVRAFQDGEQVILEVEDTGPGVPQDKIGTIFQPFYTTKPRGKGTGLGLKICSDVVAAHGGHIEVLSGAHGGAQFRVILPREPDGSGVHAIAASRPIPAPPRAPALRHQVLVIDDDPIFARTVRRALKPHEVRTASTASEALIALFDRDYLPDLILCDVYLPGSNGHTLHERVVTDRPELASRFVFVTGGALGKGEADYLRRSGCRTLFKPVNLKEILSTLEQPALDGIAPNSVRTLARKTPPPRKPKSVPPTGRGRG